MRIIKGVDVAPFLICNPSQFDLKQMLLERKVEEGEEVEEHFR